MPCRRSESQAEMIEMRKSRGLMSPLESGFSGDGGGTSQRSTWLFARRTAWAIHFRLSPIAILSTRDEPGVVRGTSSIGFTCL